MQSKMQAEFNANQPMHALFEQIKYGQKILTNCGNAEHTESQLANLAERLLIQTGRFEQCGTLKKMMTDDHVLQNRLRPASQC